MTRHQTRRLAAGLLVVGAVVFGAVQLVGNTAPDDTTGAAAANPALGQNVAVTTAAPLTPDQARQALAALEVRPEDTGNHYNRDEWGEGWASHGHGCNTRELVLRAQGTGWVAGKSCKAVCPSTGPACWVSPYDGLAVHDPGRLQIDHVVPVAEANRSGTRGWTAQQRADYYQDQANLLAVSASSNTSKSDDDPGRWRPTNQASWCWYAETWIATKTRYHLHADPAEVAGLQAMLNTCG